MKSKIFFTIILSVVLFNLNFTEMNAQTQTLYYGGDILTMEGDSPQYVEAVIEKDGKIIYAGKKANAVNNFAGKTVKVDLKGKTMMPAFVDPHSHINQVGILSSGANIFPSPDGDVNSIDKLISTLIEFKNSNPKTLEVTGWLFSMGFDDSLLSDGRYPTADDLDKVSTEVPVYIVHQSGHLGVLNHKALELVGYTDCTKEVKGGSITCVEGTNKPNGVVEENANIFAINTFLSKISPELYDEMFKISLETYASYGYTTAQEGRALTPMIETAIRAAEKGPLLLDVVMYPDFTIVDEIKPPYLTGTGVEGTKYINGFRFGGVKLTLDGSPQGKTAWLTKPYYKVPEGKDKDYRGYGQLTDEQAFKVVDDAYKNNMQILAHCNGDAAIDQYIKAVDAAVKKYGKEGRRTVIIHAQTLRADQIPRLKELGIIPSLYPMHTFYWGDWHRESVLGPERAEFISPTKAVLDAGMIFTSHHDAPVTPPNAFRVIGATVTRVTRSGKILGPDQRVSAYVGLQTATIWPAYQHFEDYKKGSIKVGKEADFIILSQNPLKVDPMKITDTEVLQTINNGKTIFKKPTIEQLSGYFIKNTMKFDANFNFKNIVVTNQTDFDTYFGVAKTMKNKIDQVNFDKNNVVALMTKPSKTSKDIDILYYEFNDDILSIQYGIKEGAKNKFKSTGLYLATIPKNIKTIDIKSKENTDRLQIK